MGKGLDTHLEKVAAHYETEGVLSVVQNDDGAKEVWAKVQQRMAKPPSVAPLDDADTSAPRDVMSTPPLCTRIQPHTSRSFI